MSDELKALENGNEWDYMNNKDPKCPHCGEIYDIQRNELFRLYEENQNHEINCLDCELDFYVESAATCTFSTNCQMGF